ncbi:hypothetical protein [Kiritimatiella glycovorans]|uniref:ABC-type transport system involved in multi-copper enzyme maturation, permease component n=1 Tax=Kiritimatiella glycovorans TaxID=1307763 RepID=A0A0G3EGI4_9BACT|nr:hypothetical protein [Kiritimatiella glycovorans]AKJ65581.1 ABC-type transport system involved in multi-copper enzyme maturation, permease component [Kiritimatiella glycovorans]
MNSIRRISVIAAMTVRAAVRSRVVLTLLGLIFFVILFLPASIRGDGTVEGYVRILLSYTLGAAAALLSLTSLWAGCAAVSGEIRARRMHVLVTRPVRRAEIWLGTWLGLVAVNAVVLAAAGAVTWGILRWNMRPSQLDADETGRLRREVLVARRALPPRPLIDAREVRGLAERWRREDRISGEADRSAVLEAARRTLRNRAGAVGPGESVRWTFDPPRAFPPGRPLHLRYELAASELGLVRIRGSWRTADGSFEQQVEIRPRVEETLTIPAAAAGGSGPIELSFFNEHDREVTLLFPHESDPELMIYETTFEVNFLRALLTVFAHLCLMSAVGVAAGTLFTMPVAVFTSSWLLLLLLCGGFVSDLARAPDLKGIPRAARPAARVYFKVLDAALSPLRGGDPLSDLSSGVSVTWTEVGGRWSSKVLLGGGAVALIGIGALRRKEIAALG